MGLGLGLGLGSGLGLGLWLGLGVCHERCLRCRQARAERPMERLRLACT